MIAEFFRQLLRFLILYLVRPVFLLLGALISSVYNVLFGWWLDEWTFKGRQSRFEHEIRTDYPWLFENYGAQIVPMQRYRQINDYVLATLSVGDLLIQFVKGGGDFRVNLAPAHAPHDWYDFGESIDLGLLVEPVRTHTTGYRMADFRRLFEANFEQLRHYFSKEEYGPSRRNRTVKNLIPL